MADWGDRPGDAGEGSGADDEAQRAAQVADARGRFTSLAIRPDHEIDLGEGALLNAAEEYPGLDIPAYIGKLDALAQRVRQRLVALEALPDRPPERVPADTDEAALAALHVVLFEEEGFTGAEREDYANPRNSFLNEVLDRKRGLPITLSVVYCEVARRAGLEAVGIGLPGHFIAQFRGQHFSTLIDPYNGGARLQREDCAGLLRRIFGVPVEVRTEHLLPAAHKAILARMLNNLKGIYVQRGQLTKALAAVERILIIQPSVDQVRDRGLLLREMGLLLLREGRQPGQPAPPDAPSGQGEPPATVPPRLRELDLAMQFLSAAWFDLKLYAREAEGQSDAAAIASRANAVWQRAGKQN
ncbi:MAG: SirB1 family protein [Chloroflexota bacterium]